MIEGVSYNSNCYLVSGKINVLVDTGTEENFSRVKGFVKEGLDLIVNTHCHYDHVGANELLKKEFGARLAAHEDDAPFISSADGSYTCAGLFGKGIPQVKVDAVLSDGQAISGTDFVVVHTPGHTPGGICLYDKNRKILITGDTVFAHGGVGRTDLPGGNQMALVSSLRKISLLDVDIILPGHGEPVLTKGSLYIKKLIRDMNF
ncbi:MAG: MBL fold metallo-hydrolase [archaeon]